MYTAIVAALITAVLGPVVVNVVIPWIKEWNLKPVKGSGHFGKFIFNWMRLSDAARKKLGQSRFISSGQTRYALDDLVESAKDGYSILAICGYKGDYSEDYYRKNFQRCKSVRRVFSYEAIRNEIQSKKERYALAGLKMHLNTEKTGACEVEVFLIPEKKHIKDVGGSGFDPPYSFGLAILQDQNNHPEKAVLHWEIDAEPLKDLLGIEGVIIDRGQQELLTELVKVHRSISSSNAVLSSRKHRGEIDRLCNEMDRVKPPPE